MGTEVPSSMPFAPSGANHVIERRSAKFHPSLWGDHFLTYDSGSTTNNEIVKKRIEKLTEEVKMMLADADELREKLNLIDQIQRLGIGYLFEREIDESLATIWDQKDWDCGDYDHDDLHITALVFRLLRQHGYRISCDVFNKFKDSRGRFRQSLAKDVRGMLSLYEASHFRVHGEDILEEALPFTVHHLKLALEDDDDPNLSPNVVAAVERALEQCLRKGLTRLEAWHYIQIHEQDASHNEMLLELAKLDFNRLQEMHKKELSGITRWWKDHVNVERNFPYARDRITECYFWILGVYFEPEFALARMMLTKVIALVSILDDTYDVYGTLEEVQLLTDAIERWDILAMDELPRYMQIYYKILLDTYREFEEFVDKGTTNYRLFHAKEAMKNQARVYLREVKWLHANYTPTLEEYMPVALETSGIRLLATTCFLGMGDTASEDVFEWLNSGPKILRGSEILSRLVSDIVGHKFEQERGHVASAIECYMKHHGATERETEKELRKMISDAWKDINEDCLRPTAVPMALLMRVLNLARTIEVLYKDKDHYTNPQTGTADNITALLLHQFPV